MSCAGKTISPPATESHFGAKGAKAAYQQILTLVPSQPEKNQQLFQISAQAGLSRIRYGARWAGCVGLVVTDVVPSGPGARLGIKVGDILIRYRDKCINDRDELRSAANKGAATEKMVVQGWRSAAPFKLEADGGELDISLSTF